MRRYVIALTGLVAAVGAAWLGGVLPWSAGTSEQLEVTGSSEHYEVTVSLDPATTGVLDARIDIDGEPVEQVWVTTAMPGMGHSMPEIAATADGSGSHVVHGELFTMRGAWELVVRVDGGSGAEAVTLDVLIER